MMEKKHNCMDFKPEYGQDMKSWVCPQCGKKWRSADVHPGNYWEEDDDGTATTKQFVN